MINELLVSFKKVSFMDAQQAATITIIVIVAVGRAVWFYIKDKKDKLKEKLIGNAKKEQQQEEGTLFAIEEHRFINETYQELIETLKQQIDSLEEDVHKLAKLREDNIRLRMKVHELETEKKYLLDRIQL